MIIVYVKPGLNRYSRLSNNIFLEDVTRKKCRTELSQTEYVRRKLLFEALTLYLYFSDPPSEYFGDFHETKIDALENEITLTDLTAVVSKSFQENLDKLKTMQLVVLTDIYSDFNHITWLQKYFLGIGSSFRITVYGNYFYMIQCSPQ